MPRFQGVPVESGGRFGGIPVEQRGLRAQLQELDKAIPKAIDYVGSRAARMAAQGAMAIPNIVGDAANEVVNIGSRALTGRNVLKPQSQAFEELLQEIGLTPPRTEAEKLAEAGGAALSGAGSAGLAARGVKAAAPRLGEALKLLSEQPKLQAAGAVAGSGAIDAARSQGVDNPLALAGIGMTASVVPGGAAGTATRVGRAGIQTVAPLARTGQETIAGGVLKRLSTTPSATQERLANAVEIVPGSRPTVSQAGGDPGLAGAETAVRGLDQRNMIGQRLAEQNLARQKELYSVAGDEATIKEAKKLQKAAYDELAVPAFKNKVPINIGRRWVDNPVLRSIQEIREKPEGARRTVQSALDHAQDMLTQEGVDLTDAETLYAIRKDLALARDGKLVGKGKDGVELANLKTARAQLDDVIGSLDDVIETGAPGFKNYLKVFAERSVPLDQLKSMQRIRSQAELAITNPGETAPTLGNKFITLLRNNLDRGMNLRGKGPKAGNLNASQLGVLQRIASDMDRGAASSASAARSPGSDTFKNLSTAAVIGKLIGDQNGELLKNKTAFKTLNVGPLSWLYHASDEAIQQIIVAAWLDPKLAASLMQKATDAEIANIGAALKQKAAAQAVSNALYSGEP